MYMAGVTTAAFAAEAAVQGSAAAVDLAYCVPFPFGAATTESQMKKHVPVSDLTAPYQSVAGLVRVED